MKSIKSISKKAYFAVITQPLLLKSRLRYLTENNAIVVMNLHRVAPNDGSAYSPLPPKFFQELVEFCEKNFRITTFSGLVDQPSRPQIIFSFDDGYRDFYDFAFPILEKRKIRVNQNIIPACVESGLPPLNVIAQDFAGKAPIELLSRIDIPGFNGTVSRENARVLSKFIKFLSAKSRAEIRSYVLEQFFSWSEFTPTPMMSLADVMEIAEIHELGAHSYEHDCLGEETDEFASDDARKCKAWFLSNLGMDPDIYAFPNGSYSERQLELIRLQGFKWLLLVEDDINNNNSIHGGCIKRFTFDAASKAELKYRATGKRKKLLL